MKLFRNQRKEFEELTKVVTTDIFRLALFRIGNRQDAEDIVQDTFLRAYRSFHTFQKGTNFKAWMTKIALNAVNDSLKKRIRLSESTTHDDYDEIDSMKSESESLQDPQVQLSSNEFDPELLHALQKLPSTLLNPLLLRELEDLTYDEIAAALSIPVGTVMSRLFRARKVLRERLMKTPLNRSKNEVPDNELQ